MHGEINEVADLSCPINCFGIRHPVSSSDAYTHEEYSLCFWLTFHVASPVNLQFDTFVRSRREDEKCLK